jgi:cell division protein FtsL
MATLAADFGSREDSGQWTGAEPVRPLRLLPSEDVYFFIKKIDNGRVVREADPAARRRAWKAGLKGFAAVAVLILFLLPRALDVVTGYRIHLLTRQHETLVNDRAAVDLEVARLSSPERLEQLARELRLVNPDPKSVVVLNSKTDSAVAMNVSR